MNEAIKLLGATVVKLLTSLILAFWVLGMVPYLISWLGFKFLPAPDPFLPIPVWSHWLIGGVLALPFAGFILWLSFAAFSWKTPWNSLMIICIAPFSIFMTGFAVNLTLGAFIPMMHTMIFGISGDIEYRVKSRHGSNYEICNSSIEVNAPVFGLQDLCVAGLSGYEGRGSIQKGTRLRVSGKASRAGVFYKSYTIVED